MEKYYISSTRISPKVLEFKMDTDGIIIGGNYYTRLSVKPKGRSINKVLVNANSPEDRIIIYK
jgi:hypothetical protein